MNKKYEEFCSYPFPEDSDWQEYLSNIYPTPNYIQIQKIKKKWYKSNIDDLFDVNYDPQIEQEQYEKYERNRFVWARPKRKQLTNFSNYQVILFLGFWASFPLSVMTKTTYHSIFLILAYIFGLAQNARMYRCNLIFLKRVLVNEDFISIIMTSIIVLTFGRTIMVWIPSLIISIIFVFSSIDIASNRYTFLKSIFESLCSKITKNRVHLYEFSIKIEVYLGLYLIICTFMKWVSIFVVILYLEAIHIRYYFQSSISNVFSELANNLRIIINNQAYPKIMRKIISWILSLGIKMGTIYLPLFNKK